jgi:hypothetical protein
LFSTTFELKVISSFVFIHIPGSFPTFPHRPFVFNNIPASFHQKTLSSFKGGSATSALRPACANASARRQKALGRRAEGRRKAFGPTPAEGLRLAGGRRVVGH